MKRLFCVLLIFSCIVFCGCADNKMNAIKTISSTIKNVQETVSEITTIPNDIFKTIPASLNCDTNLEEGTGYNGSTFVSKNNCNESYYNRLVQNTVNINNNTQYLVSRVNSKCSNLLAMCNLIEDSNNKINESHIKAISNLCDSILHNSDYIKNCSSHSYNNSKFYSNYAEIINNIEAKNSCLGSICFGLDNIYDILLNYNYFEYKTETKTTNKSWTNIDTYRNKNKVDSNNVKNNINYNNNYHNPSYNYGHGGTNPYYSYGYGARFGYGGINGYGRYPYSPFSNYNPYMPNIDTFGTYTNVDTFANYQNTITDEETDCNNCQNDNCTELKTEYSKPYLPKQKCKTLQEKEVANCY